uniref:IQ motif containing GTPase activating protein 3 n=1 Tax=Gadus morhua TaxID=8049 RepID=A0A8C5BF84_GADMO
MEACLGEELPAPTELEEGLRNGVWLAKLAHHFSPNTTPLRKIYDVDQNRYKAQGLQFRHTDNINHWRNAMAQVGLPTIFHPETTDIYDRKNMPRAVYCIHALSMYLFRLGLAPQIQDLYGKVQFTEEEINNMKLELDKYGIQMPSFSKIGGLLANELSVDQAAVHAAVLAINEAVVQGDVGATALALRNPNAMLERLQGALMAVYQEMLQQARNAKTHSKDMYEEYLSQSEIQDNINKVNVRSAVELVDEALESGQEVELLSALQLPALKLQALRAEHSPWYLDQLTSARQHCLVIYVLLWYSYTIHTRGVHGYTLQDAVRCINVALQRADSTQTLRCLLNSDAMLPDVLPFAAALYHQQLQLLQRQHPEGELQQEELYVAVEMLTAVAMVNQALEAEDLRSFCFSLRSATAGLSDIHDDLLHRYFEELLGLRSRTGRVLLTWNQLQEGITSVNIAAEEDQQRDLVLDLLQQALEGGDPRQVLSALLQPSSGVEDVVPANASRYLHLLTHAQRLKAQVWVGDPRAELSLAEVQEAVRRANQQTQRAMKGALALAAVNQAVKEGRADQTLRVLRLPEMALEGVAPECSAAYQKQLRSLLSSKAQRGDNRSPWVRSQTADGAFYFHLSRLEGNWDKPKGFTQNALFLTNQEIQVCINTRWMFNELDLLVLLQARSRGFLLRQRLSSRLLYLRSQGAAATVIQVLSLSLSLSVSVSVSVSVSLSLSLSHTLPLPVHSATPPLAVVRKFVHLLETGDGDIMQEAELLHLRQDVVTTIRSNRQLEADLDLMDLKIGLLVRNRLTLQEVVSHCKKLTKKNKEQLAGMMALERSKGLKALHKRCRDRLETYQHLFYLLQTQPLYLAQLIFLMPQTKSTRFMETLVFSLFNYGSDSREAFLLLQLFTAALRYEIRLKVEQPQEVVTGNPTVFKMLVSFYRHARGHNALRQILGSAVKDVLSDGALSIRTDPLEIYKTWINQTETRTGTKSSLPYDVSAEDALSHPEVRRRLDIAIINLKNLTDRVFIAITTNLYKLPYGLRYTAKVLRDALHSKFPEASQEELYKIVGNLIYYRYMNPAIVAPDGFDVLEISAGSTLLPEQRRVLGSIARMLQHAAANKHFQGDSPHIQNLNEYISHTHGRFRKFLQAVCDVPEPEERFNMDEYSEMVILNKPVVYISIGELLNTHKLLLEHQEALGPSPSDPLRVLLGELGGVPSLEELLGKSPSLARDSGGSSADQSKMEVSLTLTSRFDVFSDQDQSDSRGVLLSTKQLIVDLLRTQSGDSLSQLLRASTSRDQELQHGWMMQRRAQRDARTPDKMKRNQSLVADGNLSLEEKKRKIVRSLRRLEALGVLTPPDSEAQILQMIDIRHQRLYRQRRRADTLRLKQTLSSLQEKSSAHSQQVDYYSQYITSCLDSLTASKSSGKSSGKKRPSLSYSAARLQEKGVLLEIQDLPATQFKNVMFDIVAGQQTGSFQVKTRFLGVEMEEFPLKYQDLLQLQYEGVAVMKMFDKAKINVNLLIFLLNKKFFKK